MFWCVSKDLTAFKMIFFTNLTIKAVILFCTKWASVMWIINSFFLNFMSFFLKCNVFLLSKICYFKYFWSRIFLSKKFAFSGVICVAHFVGRLSMWHLIKSIFYSLIAFKAFITFAASCGIYASKDKESIKGSFPYVVKKQFACCFIAKSFYIVLIKNILYKSCKKEIIDSSNENQSQT